MLDRRLRPYAGAILNPLVCSSPRWLAPTTVSLVGLAAGLWAAYAASQADWACLANMLGAPALSFPCPTEGLPVSCQLLAAPCQDERLLSLACALDTFWD